MTTPAAHFEEVRAGGRTSDDSCGCRQGSYAAGIYLCVATALIVTGIVAVSVRALLLVACGLAAAALTGKLAGMALARRSADDPFRHLAHAVEGDGSPERMVEHGT